jgi:hypothetical protein
LHRAAECPERNLDLVGEEAIHRLLFRVRHLVSDEPLDERPIAFGIHGRIETDVTRVERGKRLHDVDDSPVSCESSSGVGSRRSFCRRISDALMMRERSAVRLSGTRTVRPAARATRESPDESTTRRTR